MAQVTDRTVGANPTGFDMRTELNNIISALESDNSGSSEPLNTVAYMKWLDTSNATYYYVKERNHDNTAWVTLFRYTVATKIMEAVSNGVVLSQTDIASEIHASSSKTIPIDADEMGLIDSASSFSLKKLTWANLKATLKTYLDTLYQSTLVSGTNIKTINSNSILGSGDLVVSALDATNSVKGIDYKGLLAEYTVSGSAVTSIDFSGLDINTHKSYRVEINIVGAITSDIRCFVNGDTTLTNYYSEEVSGLASSVYSANRNEPKIGQSYSGYVSNATLNIALVGSKVTSNCVWSTYNYSSITGVQKTATVTNITQLTFTSSAASAIGVGSKIRLYRGDV